MYRELLQRGRSHTAVGCRAGDDSRTKQKKGKADNDDTEGSVATEAMENKFAVIESKVQTLTSLEDLLEKMEKRMASTEEKVTKVDKLEKSATSLAMIVEMLVEKVGWNPGDS